MNMNDFAKEVADLEVGKEEVSIAQVKEILKVAFTQLGLRSDEEILKTVNRYRDK
jgi:hypothetical protein